MTFQMVKLTSNLYYCALFVRSGNAFIPNIQTKQPRKKGNWNTLVTFFKTTYSR